jgi:hypothetical protein
MMDARDELAKLIFITDNLNANDPEAEWADAVQRDVDYERKGHRFDWKKTTEYAYSIADGLLAAGYKRVKA